ncbi:MAG TPA: GtrA family protein [Gammaproteobacteria bacterium]|nr:GtrA family protein [Gammaproteobacteria bacterium]
MPAFSLRHPFARFVVVGCANFVVSFAAFYASYRYLPLDDSSGRGAIANVLAYCAGLVNSFVLNRLWTFRAEGHVAVHALKFGLLNAATLVASTAIVLVLVDRAGLPWLAVWLPLTLAILATHYLGMKHWAFAERR